MPLLLSRMPQGRNNSSEGGLMSGSALEVCCATACQLMCSEEPACQTGDDSAPEIPEPEELGPEAWADLHVRSMVTCGDGAAMICSGASGADKDANDTSNTSRIGDSS